MTETKYMEPTDPGAFTDWPQEVVERLRVGSHAQGFTKQCPRCKGHGGWNLKLNSYPLREREDSEANRHLFSHFRAHCMHCNGWGWTAPDENCPGHEWEPVRSVGNCLTLHRCTVCGKEWVIDSSD